MNLTEDVLRNFEIGRIFKPPVVETNSRINSISFHRKYDLLVSASNNDEINVYDTYHGERQATFFSKKYGVANVSFTHNPNSIIYSSTKLDHAWRYHDLHKNEYIRFFNGHVGRVTTLAQSPLNDAVLSAAEDNQVRLWDLRSGLCHAMLQAPGSPSIAWDEQGLVFAVGTESGVIKLYDARKFLDGPFTTFVVSNECNSKVGFSCLRFSMNGESLLGVVEGRIYVLNAYSGEVLRAVSNGVPDGATALEASLTADGRYIISGCWDRHVRVWSVETGAMISTWQQHADLPTCLKCSPRTMMVASACQALLFWIPDTTKLSSTQPIMNSKPETILRAEGAQQFVPSTWA